MSRPSTKKEQAAAAQAITQQPEAVTLDPAAEQSTKMTTAATSKYSVDELAAAAPTLFGGKVSPDCVAAALWMRDDDRFTREEAVRIVNEFMKKEVK